MKKVCLERGCMALIEVTEGPRCRGHKAAYQRGRDARRGTPAQRGYNYTYRKLRAAILSAYPPPTCVYCNALADTVDHVLPLAFGGTNTIDNLVPACQPCNLSRGGRSARCRRGGDK